MKKTILAILMFAVHANLLSQELKTSKSSLFFYIGLPYDTITVYNTGSAQLLIDSMRSKSMSLGYRLYIIYRDSTKSYFVFPSIGLFNVPIKPNDSVRLAFGRPFCAICKTQDGFYDTLVLHSNSLFNNYTTISVQGEGSTLVNEHIAISDQYVLFQNYPNPFNPTTSIPFSLAQADFITINVYNNLGQLVSVVFSGKLEAGSYFKSWEASQFSSGIYFYELKSSKFTATGKMILAK